MKAALCVAATAVILHAASPLDRFFVSDDFLNYERSSFRTLREAIALFATQHVDFYRPLPRLHFGVLAALVGDRSVVWNAAGLLLHALTSVAALMLARSLLGSRGPAALFAGLFFAAHFAHVEPVFWASGVTTLYATLFVLLALLAFRRARETQDVRWRTRSVAAFSLALLSKETAVAFLPLLFLTTAWSPPRPPGDEASPRLPSPGELVPYAVLLAAWTWIAAGIDRGGVASPYGPELGANVLKNLAFFLVGSFLPLQYWRVQEMWGAREGLPGFAGALLGEPLLWVPMTVGAAALCAVAVRGGASMRLGLAWIVVAALPFLLLPGSGERFLYLPSFGACLALGAALAVVVPRPTRFVAVAAVLALFAAGSLDRQRDWATASRWTRNIVGRWEYFRNLDADSPIEFLGIPDRYRSAWVFRNGFDSMVRLYWEGRPYAREGDLPSGSAEPERMAVELHPGGPVGMAPERFLRRP